MNPLEGSIVDTDGVLTEMPKGMERTSSGPTPVETGVGDDGAALVRIPIAMPPGRDGHEPTLTLAYSSKGSDGPVGMGWELQGLSQISRCGTDLSFDDVRDARVWSSEAICLDGRRLVPDDSGHFRLRFGGRERVRLSGELDDPESHFIVDFPDGTRRIYGRREDARVWAHPEGSSARPVVWMLDSVRDIHGNLVDYKYESTGLQEGAMEVTLLSSIEYGHHESEPIAAHAKVRLEYADRDGTVLFHSGVGSAVQRELQTIVTEGAGVVVRTYELSHRSRGVGRELVSVQECDGRDVCREPVRFSWSTPRLNFLPLETTSEAAPVLFEELGFDFNSAASYVTQIDRRDEGLRPSFEYRSGLRERRFLRFSDGNWRSSPSFAGSGTFVPFDYDADGDSEVLVSFGGESVLLYDIRVSDERIRYGDVLEDYTSTFGTKGILQGDFDGDGSVELRGSDGGLHVLDFDGDGRVDVVRAAGSRPPYYSNVQLSSGGFVRVDVSPERQIFADVNGDGLLDVVEVVESWNPYDNSGVDSRARIYINRGGGLDEGRDAFRLGSQDLPARHLFRYLDAGHVLPIDINRDGRDDLIVAHQHASGSSIYGCAPLFATACLHRLDLVAYFSDGETWGDPVRLTNDDFRAAFTRPTVITWRDGTLAIVGAVGVDRLALRPLRVDDGSLLTSISQGDRELVAYEYDRFGSPTSHHERVDVADGEPPLHPEQMREEDGLVLVNAHVDELGRRFEHWYSDGRTERKTGRFLGFRRKLTYEPETGRLRETVRDTSTFVEGVGFPFAGIVIEENHYFPLGDLKHPDSYTIHRTLATPELITIDADEDFPSYVPVVSSTVERVLEGVQPRWRPEPGWPEFGALIEPPLRLYEQETLATRMVRTSGGVSTHFSVTDLVHDELGFVTETATTTENGFERTTVSTHDARVDDQRYMPWLPELVVRNTEADSGRLAVDIRVLKYDDEGRLRAVVRRANGGADSVETSYDRTRLGLIERVRDYSTADGERITRIDWDSYGLAPERVQNAEGHVELSVVHPAFGVPVVGVDANGIVSRASYDGFGRLRSTTTLAGVSEVIYGYGEGAERIAQRRPGEAWSQQVLDEHARPVRLVMDAPNDRRSVVEVEYDERGRIANTTLPRFEGQARHVATNYVYDGLDRVTASFPGAFLYRAGVRHEYEPGRRRSFAADGIERRLGAVVDEQFDSAGRLRSVKTSTDDAGTTAMEYEYGTAGLEVVTDHDGTQWATDLDRFERPTSTYDPDAGSRFYRFNAFGEVEAELDDAGNEILTIDRDRLGRPIRFEHRDEGATTVQWDPVGGIGRPEWVLDEASGVQVTWAYEPDTGRLAAETTTAPDGSEYRTKLAYDAFGRPLTVSYGEVSIRYAYDDFGNVEQLIDDRTETELWRALELDATGNVVAERWSAARGADGRRVERRTEFDPRTGEVNEIALDRGLDRLEAMSFVYDQLGRLESVSSLKRGRDEAFEYDDLHRIRRWLVNGTEVSEFSYDDIGNLKSRFGVDLLRNDPTQPHRLTGLVAGGAATSVDYDERGRRHQWGAREVEYNRFDLPTSIRDAGSEIASYAYDGLGRRVWSQDERGETVYAGGGLWEVRRGNDGRRTTTVHLRTPSGTPIELVATEGDSDLEVLYSLTDVLGSARATVDRNADIVAFHDFDPFGAPTDEDGRPQGEIVGLPSGLDRGFTGHRHDPTGLIDMGGRVYDPMTASFLTPDPVVVDLTNRQALNPYSYVLNSPTNLTDPTGFSPAEYGNNGGWAGAGLGTILSILAYRFGLSDHNPEGPVYLVADGYVPRHDAPQRAPRTDIRGTRRTQSSSAAARSRDPGIVTVPHVEIGMTDLSMHDFGARSYDDIVRVGAMVARDYVQEINSRGRPSIAGVDLGPTDVPGMMADGVTEFLDNVATVHDTRASGWSRLWAGANIGLSFGTAGVRQTVRGVRSANRMRVAIRRMLSQGRERARGAVALDTNSIIRALEAGELAAVDAAIAGRVPVVPFPVVREFLKKGDAGLLREFLRARNGRVGRPGTEQAASALRDLAASLNRSLKVKDSRVVAAMQREGLLGLITRDDKLTKFLRAIGMQGIGF